MRTNVDIDLLTRGLEPLRDQGKLSSFVQKGPRSDALIRPDSAHPSSRSRNTPPSNP